MLKFQIVLKVRILMLLSPTSTQYLVGAPFYEITRKKETAGMPCRIFTRRKRREFDGFLGFFAGSENPCVRVAQLRF